MKPTHLPSLHVRKDDYMFAPLDECRVIPKGEREMARIGPVRVYESGSARRYVYLNEKNEIVACFLVTVHKLLLQEILSLIRVRDDYKGKGYGTLLYMIIRSHYQRIRFWHTSAVGQAFANAVMKA